MTIDVPILYHDPKKPGAIQMKGYATDAYSGFSGDAQELAVRTVATEFGITEREAMASYEIYITPGMGYHGKIFAVKK